MLTEPETEILFPYWQNLKEKESQYDPSDVTDHPIGGGKLSEKEKCGVEVNFMVPRRGQAPDLHCGCNNLYVRVCVCVQEIHFYHSDVT